MTVWDPDDFLGLGVYQHKPKIAGSDDFIFTWQEVFEPPGVGEPPAERSCNC